MPPTWPIGSTPTACSASDLAVDRVDGADGAARLVVKLPTWNDYPGMAGEKFSASASAILAGRRVSGPLEQSSRRCYPSTMGQVEGRLEMVNAYLEP